MDIMKEEVEKVEEKDELEEKKEPEKKTKSLKVKIINIIIVLLMIIFSIYMYSKYVGTKGISVKEYRLSSTKIPSNFNGIKIIYFSDLLFGSTLNVEDLTKIKDEINLFRPDIVIFGGDLLSNTYNIKEEEKTNIIKLLSSINAKIGKYATLGALDNDETLELLNKANFKILNNQDELIYHEDNTPICLVGIGSYNLSNYNFENTFKCSEYYTIAISHEPDIIDNILANNKVDVFLSGNSLGGEINIPFIGGLETFDGSEKYKNEYYKIDDTQIFISNGIGTKKQYKRLFNKPSFNLFRLKNMETFSETPL